MKYRNKVKDEIDRMEQSGIIRRSRSNYISPLVVVIKKDESIRLCLDARRLNEKLVEDHEGPQTIDELYQQCRNMKVMSSFDLRSSFWQIPLAEEGKKFTAFVFEGHVYEFNVMPFGLKVSGAALIRGLNRVINKDPKTLNFIDDILCLEENNELHFNQIVSLFKELQICGLTLNFEKNEVF